MERFISVQISVHSSSVHHLKSNMERFISVQGHANYDEYGNLKSNMERFISVIKTDQYSWELLLAKLSK